MKTTICEDSWQGAGLTEAESTISDPAMAVASIARLDGDSRTMVSLSRGDAMLCIGGGNDARYVAYFALNIDEVLFTLVDPVAPEKGPEMEVVAGGQAGTCPPRMCVALETVTKAATHFVETGERSPALHWVEG